MVTRHSGTVLSAVGGSYRVFGQHETWDASLRGRLKHGSHRRVLVGDSVMFRVHEDGSATIEEVLERRSVLVRRAPGKTRGTRTVAANVDQVVVVGAADEPPWDARVTDRFLVVAEANHLPSLIVVNKADLAADASQLAEIYRLAGYEVVVTSVPQAVGIETLRDKLTDRVSLFTGSTGVGKSSLLNALQPGLRLRTGEVSARTRSGRHTTVAAEMHPLESGGFVVDTPGLRDIGLWALDPREVSAAFPEFAIHARACRFDDCRHLGEPGCEVTAATKRGEISETRLASYRRLLEEALQASAY